MITLDHIDKVVDEPNGTGRRIFDGLCLQIDPGVSSVAVMGRSGSGKSTLLKILAGLDVGYDGRYFFSDSLVPKDRTQATALRKSSIGYVAQSYDLLGDRTVLENVTVSPRPSWLLSRRERASRRDRARHLLDVVGVGHLASTRASRISGGEAQRVAVARSLFSRPTMLLADEPTGALDARTERHLLDTFEELQHDGLFMIVATHSQQIARRCHAQVTINDGRLN